MGRILSRGAPMVLSIFSSHSFFVRPGNRFFVPTHASEWPARAGAVKDGAQRHPEGLVLDGSEHDGILECVGMTMSEGSSHVGARTIVPHPSIRWTRDPTMMQ
jgi:hypothetical protein